MLLERSDGSVPCLYSERWRAVSRPEMTWLGKIPNSIVSMKEKSSCFLNVFSWKVDPETYSSNKRNDFQLQDIFTAIIMILCTFIKHAKKTAEL